MIKELDKILDTYRQRNGNIISLLQETEEAFGYIPREAVEYFSETLQIASSRFYGVATFYAQFHLKPRGKHIITACCGTACHVKGSERIINGITKNLDLAEGEDTSSDMQFTLERVNCVGACGIAPVCIIDKKVYGKTSSDKILREIKALRAVSDEAKDD